MEKFLRRNSFSSADEKDSSSKTSSITTSKPKCQTKSLESLNELNKSKEEATKIKTPSLSQIKPNKEQTQHKQPSENKSMEAPKVIVKQSSEKVDKKKSFNYESIIEITLPQQQQQQQSFPLHFPTPTIHHEEKLEEEPIKPIISTPKSSKIPSIVCGSDKKISPSSANDESFVSINKQNPMEWDDFLPVSRNFVKFYYVAMDEKAVAIKTMFINSFYLFPFHILRRAMIWIIHK